MRWGLLITLGCLFGCAGPTEPWPVDPVGGLQGPLQLADGSRGDGWLFLYAPGEGPPGSPAVPGYVTAVSDTRVQQPPAEYVFARVKPNPFRLWGLLDVNGNFRADVDVLAQPGAGDRVGDGLEVNLQPGRMVDQAYAIEHPVLAEPPAFRLDQVTDEVALDFSVTTPTTLTLVSDGLQGTLEGQKVAFHVGLVDANNDGRPDDANGDNIPDLSLQVFLRWKPLPGQAPASGNVIVPLFFDPGPFLSTLSGRLDTEVVVTTLQVTAVGSAEQVTTNPGKPPTVVVIGPPPKGDYELIALTGTGQYWRLPNGLAGTFASQGVRFHFDRSSR